MLPFTVEPAPPFRSPDCQKNRIGFLAGSVDSAAEGVCGGCSLPVEMTVAPHMPNPILLWPGWKGGKVAKQEKEKEKECGGLWSATRKPGTTCERRAHGCLRARARVCQGNNLPPHNSTSPNATSLIVSVVLPSVAVIVDVICATMAGRLAIHRPSLDGSGAAEVATY